MEEYSGTDTPGSRGGREDRAEAATAPPTNLLSLPTELLIKIARDVAPQGGRKAGNLRLVCRHLGRVIAPITWASIVLPTDLEGLDEIGDVLLNDRTGHRSYITSVRYNKPRKQLRKIVAALKALPALRRLHLAGTTSNELFVPKHDLLGSLPLIESLQLDYIDLDSMTDLESWAPNVSFLGLAQCACEDELFSDTNTPNTFKYNRITSLNYSMRGVCHHYPTDATIMALITCELATSLTFDMNLTAPGDYAAYMLDEDFGSRTEPFSLKLAGATKLFANSPPNDPAVTLVVRILNWVSLGPLNTLNLSVFEAFFANDALANLSLPRVRELVLEVDADKEQLFGTVDSAMIRNCEQLVRFLKIASHPSLSTLRLRSWFSVSKITNLGLSPPCVLPAESPLVGVLDFLRTTTVMELRMESSIGETEVEVQCIFSREVGGEWSSRLARFW